MRSSALDHGILLVISLAPMNLFFELILGCMTFVSRYYRV